MPEIPAPCVPGASLQPSIPTPGRKGAALAPPGPVVLPSLHKAASSLSSFDPRAGKGPAYITPLGSHGYVFFNSFKIFH